MKKLLPAFLLFPFITLAQPAGQWTWMKGTGAITTSTPVYGTQGVEASSNTPGSIYESCEWTDQQGNFWIFGGLDPNGLQMGDLWRFNPVTTNWTWMKGPGAGNQTGVYGTKGVPAALNQPGGRAWGIVSWVDNNGTFWMYGGYGYDGIGSFGYLDDLWSFNLSTNDWTWVSGTNASNSPALFGAKGVAKPSNLPPPLCETAAGWTDPSGNLWLFGGLDNSSYNTLWKYDMSAMQWTWIRGDTVSFAPGSYGTKGLASPANDPPFRDVYARWKDAANNFWLFAGQSGFTNTLNDLWEYNMTTNEWTWVNGPNTPNDAGVTGINCIGSASNRPAARYENRAVWTDKCGNFYNFGGYDGTYSYNDLWQYNPVANQWKLISGGAPGSIGSYGSLGVSSPANMPPSRLGSNSFTDANGNLWLFGGWQSVGGYKLNDVWRFVPDSSCTGSCNLAIVPPVANFQASDTILCAYDCISYTNFSTNATSYQWSFDGGIPPASTDTNPQNICYLTPGTYAATLIAINSGASDTLKITNYIYVSSVPATPDITLSNDTLFCSFDTSYISYQWYYDDTLLTGQTNPFLKINKNGNYNIAVKNSSGCSISVGIIILRVQNISADNPVWLSPNPAKDELRIRNAALRIAAIEIYNITGEVCYKSEIADRNSEIILDVSGFSSGIYFVHLSNESRSWTAKFVKE